MSIKRISWPHLANDMIGSALFLIVLVVVIVWFAKSAGEVGENQITWSFIGAASFGIPVLLTVEVSKFFIKSSGGMTRSAFTMMNAAAIFAVIIGVAACFFVHKALLARQSDA